MITIKSKKLVLQRLTLKLFRISTISWHEELRRRLVCYGMEEVELASIFSTFINPLYGLPQKHRDAESFPSGFPGKEGLDPFRQVSSFIEVGGRLVCQIA